MIRANFLSYSDGSGLVSCGIDDDSTVGPGTRASTVIPPDQVDEGHTIVRRAINFPSHRVDHP